MNYYVVLGIAEDADEETIRSAFRALARRYHPDVDEYVVPHHPADTDIAALRDQVAGLAVAGASKISRSIILEALVLATSIGLSRLLRRG